MRPGHFTGVLTVVAMGAPAMGAPGQAKKKTPKCAGKLASVVGTHGADKIKLGGKEGRVVVSMGGRDRIVGSNKRDLICSGRGPDRIVSGEGSDRIIAEGGADVVSAGAGDDTVAGGAGLDKIKGAGGNDSLYGGKEADAISGGPGADGIFPAGAKDRASGGAGNDLLIGARGNDRLVGGSGDDSLDGQVGDDRMRGGSGADELIGENGTDRINGGDGDDRVNGGPGPDEVDSGGGSDRIVGEGGGDTLLSGDGEDLLIGGTGGERMDGGRGADRIYGGLVDDEMFGGPGDDLLVGGHGVDAMHGGDGNDWMRGDTNRDIHFGDGGQDTASYATATPPGPAGIEGVNVNLATEEGLEDEPQLIIVGDYKPPEPLHATESVVGSNYDDVLAGNGQGTARGLGGNELCSGFLAEDCGGGPAPNVSLDTTAIDPGLLVRGGPGAEADTLALSVTADSYVVTSASPLTAGTGCANNSPVVVACAAPGTALAYATVWGGDGPDQLTIGDGFPSQAVIVLDGGAGDDVLKGSAGDDILRAGPDGADDLDGRAGNDALFSGPGSDTLDGGDGSDQLVTTDPCGGHDFKGGSGDGDIAGFAQSIEQGVIATLGGTAVGRAQSPCPPTRVRSDLMLGNEGDDILIGLSGADVLRGEQGVDALYGGKGSDLLEAFDRNRDLALHCGPGGNRVIRDKVDPPGANCSEPKKRGKR